MTLKLLQFSESEVKLLRQTSLPPAAGAQSENSSAGKQDAEAQAETEARVADSQQADGESQQVAQSSQRDPESQAQVEA